LSILFEVISIGLGFSLPSQSSTSPTYPSYKNDTTHTACTAKPAYASSNPNYTTPKPHHNQYTHPYVSAAPPHQKHHPKTHTKQTITTPNHIDISPIRNQIGRSTLCTEKKHTKNENSLLILTKNPDFKDISIIKPE